MHDLSFSFRDIGVTSGALGRTCNINLSLEAVEIVLLPNNTSTKCPNKTCRFLVPTVFHVNIFLAMTFNSAANQLKYPPFPHTSLGAQWPHRPI